MSVNICADFGSVACELQYDPTVAADIFPSMVSECVRIEYRQHRKVWEFPTERFVQDGPEDEDWCRFFGVGMEVTREETVTIPRAIITGMTENSVSLKAGAMPHREFVL